MYLIVSIPDANKCLLKAGQSVNFDTPFLENKIICDITIQVAKKLAIPSDKIFNYLNKYVGDSIETGDILAEKKGLLGNSKIVSDSKGLIKEINHYTGEMIISTMTTQNGHVKAFFKGEVEEIGKKQIKLKVTEAYEFSTKFTSVDFGGETFYLKNSSDSIVAQQMTNKILISESLSPYLLTKTEALGITGLVSLKMPSQDSDLAKSQVKNIDDFKKIFQLNLPYCLINKHYSKIYFYK